MPAIKSVKFCSAEFWCADGALTELALARRGSVQPMRHARTASHTESPAATADFKV